MFQKVFLSPMYFSIWTKLLCTQCLAHLLLKASASGAGDASEPSSGTASTRAVGDARGSRGAKSRRLREARSSVWRRRFSSKTSTNGCLELDQGMNCERNDFYNYPVNISELQVYTFEVLQFIQSRTLPRPSCGIFHKSISGRIPMLQAPHMLHKVCQHNVPIIRCQHRAHPWM